MKTKAEKEFDKWIREFVGIQDEYLFQKGTLVRTVAIKYAEFIASQPSDVSDRDIEIWATDKCIKEKSRYYADISTHYIEGAKAMRDGQIKPTIEGECKHLKTQDSVCGWSVDHICNTKDCPAYNPPKVYYCTICKKNPVDAENGYDTCQDCINKV